MKTSNIYTTGAFLAPVNLKYSNGNTEWMWVVSGFEDDSYLDGKICSPVERAGSIGKLFLSDEDDDDMQNATIESEGIETVAECEKEDRQWHDAEDGLPDENVYVVCRYDDYYFIGYVEDGIWHNHSAADTILATDEIQVEQWKYF